MGIKLMLNDVRCSFLMLGDPEYYGGQKTKDTDKRRWSATALVPNGSPLKAQIDKTLKDVAMAQWEKKWETYYENIIVDPKGCCWIDGKRKEYDGYQGHWALTAHRPEDKGRPIVLDTDKSPIYKANNEIYEGKAGRIYSGCYVNASIEFFGYDNTGKGLSAQLRGVQFYKDGDSFGGGRGKRRPVYLSDISHRVQRQPSIRIDMVHWPCTIREGLERDRERGATR